jgi:hypothetical protein
VSHVRTQIRAAVVSALESLGGVHVSRARTLQPDELPVYLVYTQSEEIESDFEHHNRALQVVVEVVIASQNFDDDLDDQVLAVEQLLSDTDLDGLVQSFIPTSIETSFSAEGVAPIGRARITYEARYRTAFADPELSI